MTTALLDLPGQDERGIAEFASESVVIFDPAGTILYWNPAAERLFGWPALAVRGTDMAQLAFTPDGEDQAWAQLMQEGAWHGLIRRRTRDGGACLADARRHLRFDAAGAPRDIVEFARPAEPTATGEALEGTVPDRLMAASWQIDIGPAAEILARIAALRGPDDAAERSDLYRQLVAAARIVEVNERTARLVGGNRGPALLAGQSVAAFWPTDSRTILAELIVEALDAPHRRPCRRALASDGILRDPLVTVWRAGADRPGRLFVTVNGAADDDRSYLFLRASEARYRKLTHYMPVALWQVDASHMAKIYAELRACGVTDFAAYLDEHPELVDLAAASVPVTDVNRCAIELVGGAGVQDLIRPVGYLFAESPASLRRVMIGRFSGQRNYNEFMKLRTLDGRLLDVRFSVTYPEPLLELDTTIFSLEDVTEHLRMETQLRQLQADFSHAARVSMLGEFTSSIAHEVNQPLSAIMTNAETSLRWLAREEPDIAKVTELTARIAASARRADDIVQRVRGMAVNQQPNPVPLALNDVVQESLLFVGHELETRAVRVATSFASDVPPVVGDRVQLQQVIVNLLINAVQAVEGLVESAREIRVATSADADSGVTFTLCDSGPGIAPEYLDHIFDGFFTTKPQGMGIGLAICRSIVEAHGGNLRAENGDPVGARFTFSLPKMMEGDG